LSNHKRHLQHDHQDMHTQANHDGCSSSLLRGYVPIVPEPSLPP
jgi:hypothetical protein